MKILKTCQLFYMGGAAYMVLEFLWRGHSHYSMFLLGGSCFLMLGQLRKLRLPLPILVVFGAIGITALELVTGLLVNRDYSIWDYRQLPFHYLGHICLNYSLLWMPVGFAGMELYHLADTVISFYR